MSNTSLSLRFANLYLASYGLDAVCSTLVLGVMPGSAPLLMDVFQRLLASWVFTMTLLMIPLLAMRPRVPLGLFSGVVASVFWLGTGAAPIPLWVAPDAGLPLALALLQVGFAALSFGWIRRCNADDGFFLRELNEDASAPSESEGQRLLRFSLLAVLVGLPVLAGYGAISLATWVAVETQHFVVLDGTGVRLSDRRYVRDEQEVRLVGMMHLGEPEVYHDIARSFLGPDTIVLEEGVTDEDAVLEQSLQYGTVAGRLGLTAQRSFGSYLSELDDAKSMAVDERPLPELRNADVDSRAFSSGTQRLLAKAAVVWSDDDFTRAFLDLYQELIEDPEATEDFLYDIIELRNRHLERHLLVALNERSRVIVPWGALHLPDIERFVIQLGFERVDEIERHVVSWPTLVRALRE